MKLNDAKKIREEFITNYLFSGRFNEYVQGTGDTVTIRVMQGKKPDLEIDLKKGESLDDFCFDVWLKKNPPDDLGLPERYYKGVRVFYELTDEIVPYKTS